MSDDVDDAEAGEGEGAGNSSSQEQMVPLSALMAERGKRHDLERDVAELKGTVDTLKEGQNKPKEYSRSELQAAVDSAQISQERADQILDEQRERKIEERVSERLSTKAADETRATRIDAEIAKYKQWKPSIMEDGSEARAAVAEAYLYQVEVLGKPQNKQTELDALMQTYGPANKLQTGQKQEPQTHQESGSDGGGDGGKGKEPKLPANVKAHYSRMIDRGIYKGWDDPTLKKEVEDYGHRWKRSA